MTVNMPHMYVEMQELLQQKLHLAANDFSVCCNAKCNQIEVFDVNQI